MMHLKKMCSWDPTDTDGPKGQSCLLKFIAFACVLVTLILAVTVAALVIFYRPSVYNDKGVNYF